MKNNDLNAARNLISPRSLGKTGYLVSVAGFGCYRVDAASQIHRDAMVKALRSGINVIDTSANYMDGGSELLAGSVLRKLTESGELKRGDIVVVTKGGYIQGKNYDISAARKKEGAPWPDLVEYAEGLEHCIHPDFLDEQMTASLARLDIDAIDVYLLHNPEYYLLWAEKNGIEIEKARGEYYSRIEKAFRFLETEVKKGRIKYYGISSNTFPAAAAAYNFTSLGRVISIAEKISPGNHFGVIEFPMNLFERGAASEKNQDGGLTLLELARSKNIGVLINRPLNAFFKGTLLRLADPRGAGPSGYDFVTAEKSIDDAVRDIGILEENLMESVERLSEKAREKAEIIFENILVYGQLNLKWKEFGNISNFESFMSGYYSPRAEYFLNSLKKGVLKDKKTEDEFSVYINRAFSVFEDIGEYFKAKHLKTVIKIKEKLSGLSPFYSAADDLSDIAVRALACTNGVGLVLVGMRTPDYVAKVETALKAVSGAQQTDWQKLSKIDSFNSFE
ncbi:MAG TPA: aldo/keto reductase [Candidatus Wallbacteria bacterium]|nr:MAG: Aldo/keto reductase family protein [bacterium ADurb.Bin243]HPG57411.1 aldo/keto reductase [Candidatus Wallbacteria bacterium]